MECDSVRLRHRPLRPVRRRRGETDLESRELRGTVEAAEHRRLSDGSRELRIRSKVEGRRSMGMAIEIER